MRLPARCPCQASTLPRGTIPPLASIHQFQDGCGVCAWGFSSGVITAPVFSSNPPGYQCRGKAGERKEARGVRAVGRRQGLLPSPIPRKECQHLLCASWRPPFPPSRPSTPIATEEWNCRGTSLIHKPEIQTVSKPQGLA